MSERILMAHDFSPCAAAALTEALADAHRHTAAGKKVTLILLHVAAVVPVLPVGVELGSNAATTQLTLERTLTQEAQVELEAIADAARKAHADIEVETSIVTSTSVSDAILGELKHKKATRLIVGTHGKRGLAHLLLGSVAERLVRDAPVPVVVVKVPS